MKQQICLLAALAALDLVSSDKSQSIGAENARANRCYLQKSSWQDGSKTANLGGLSGADKLCQGLASAVGLGNKTWRAYLSVERDPGNGTSRRMRAVASVRVPG